MSSRKGAPGRRWLRLGLLAASLSILAGCASTFPDWKPDRCHRAERARETLNWDIFCIQTP
ncbi:MAG: hypothetical protein HYY64_13475 [Candidatus Rokubacteria bacterium]|nr:hypothetical protein [Candidatus Rokubacteria bacterium]